MEAIPPASNVTVVVPTYNEAANLPTLVEQLAALALPGLHLLVVDDGSPDGTGEVARHLAPRLEGRVHVLERPGKLGLGSAYKQGFAWALEHGADYIVEMDADLSHSPSYLPRMLERIQHADVVVGSRWTKGGGVDSNWGLSRRLLSRGGSLYARLCLGLRVRDTTTGFKCFRREALAGLNFAEIKSSGFGFQVEMAWLCQRQGYQVEELPIRFVERTTGKSKLSLRIIVEALWRVAAIRLTARA